jgi:ATP-dependent DNA helicase RecQ
VDLSATRLAAALSRLQETGALKLARDGSVHAVEHPPDAVRAAAEAEERRRSFDRSRVDMVRAYAETGDCRRAFLLSYFGEPFTPPCGRCDNCEAGLTGPPPADVPFAVGARVEHGQWGEGVVQRYDDDAVVVLFDQAGYKTLALDVVVERGLLRAAHSSSSPE